MKKFSKDEQAKVKSTFETYKKGEFSGEDTENVLEHEQDILNKSSDGPLAKFFEEIKIMCSMVKAWAKKEYKVIPTKTIGMIILGLIYVFFPADLIPDAIPGVGLLDDASLIGYIIAAAKSDIEDFKKWVSVHK